ncbi:50S ribosomal protein L3 [Candidatus Uhrbacteria bacterium]|nr:50S ribosomal protein L3 [Candidatus Uhrbacteria bacterium]
MKFILGQKLHMTQIFGPNGAVVPATRVFVGPCVVTQVKTQKKDGYAAIQVGSGAKKKISKSLRNHFQGLPHVSEKKGFRFLKEVRVPSVEGVERGMEIALSTFSIGDRVQVTGTSKGKGFAGVVKRHGFHGHPTTHGHKDQERMPGSIGAGGVQHVFKGKRMGGRMGFDRVTVKNLSIVDVNPDSHTLLICGSIPGAPKSLVIIQADGDLVFKKTASAVQETADTQEVSQAQEPIATQEQAIVQEPSKQELPLA